jgi:hypothetical protein
MLDHSSPEKRAELVKVIAEALSGRRGTRQLLKDPRACEAVADAITSRYDLIGPCQSEDEFRATCEEISRKVKLELETLRRRPEDSCPRPA